MQTCLVEWSLVPSSRGFLIWVLSHVGPAFLMGPKLDPLYRGKFATLLGSENQISQEWNKDLNRVKWDFQSCVNICD